MAVRTYVVLWCLLALTVIGGMSFALVSYNNQAWEALGAQVWEAKMEAARATASASINIEYDVILQSLLAKMQEYDTLAKFTEKEITGLARLIMEQTAIHREAGLTPSLVLAVTEIESGFDPTAVSSAGAIGLLQIMPGTSRKYLQQLGYMEYSDQLLMDPLINARIGIEHLLFLHRMFTAEGIEDTDDFDLSLVAYNWGEGPLRRLIAGLDDPADLRYAIKVKDRIAAYTERGLD